MQCRQSSLGDDEIQKHLEKCNFTKFIRNLNNNIRELNRKANQNNKGNGQSRTYSKATHGGRSSSFGQEPQGTGTDSPDESKETCFIICEGLIQDIEATSAVIIHDYPQ